MELQLLTQFVAELDEENVFAFLKKYINSELVQLELNIEKSDRKSTSPFNSKEKLDKPSQSDAQKAVEACLEGMAQVSERFDRGEYFMSDLIYAGELLTDAIDLLKPILGNDYNKKVGTIVLGTVHGDLHDIGKNIFRSMVEAVGFEVIDLGIDQPVSSFVDKVKEVRPDIVAMSGLVTLALEAMKHTIDGLKEADLRSTVKIIIGGNPVTQKICEHIGADAFTINAIEGVKICLEWMKSKTA